MIKITVLDYEYEFTDPDTGKGLDPLGGSPTDAQVTRRLELLRWHLTRVKQGTLAQSRPDVYPELVRALEAMHTQLEAWVAAKAAA